MPRTKAIFLRRLIVAAGFFGATSVVWAQGAPLDQSLVHSRDFHRSKENPEGLVTKYIPIPIFVVAQQLNWPGKESTPDNCRELSKRLREELARHDVEIPFPAPTNQAFPKLAYVSDANVVIRATAEEVNIVRRLIMSWRHARAIPIEYIAYRTSLARAREQIGKFGFRLETNNFAKDSHIAINSAPGPQTAAHLQSIAETRGSQSFNAPVALGIIGLSDVSSLTELFRSVSKYEISGPMRVNAPLAEALSLHVFYSRKIPGEIRVPEPRLTLKFLEDSGADEIERKFCLGAEYFRQTRTSTIEVGGIRYDSIPAFEGTQANDCRPLKDGQAILLIWYTFEAHHPFNALVSAAFPRFDLDSILKATQPKSQPAVMMEEAGKATVTFLVIRPKFP